MRRHLTLGGRLVACSAVSALAVAALAPSWAGITLAAATLTLLAVVDATLALSCRDMTVSRPTAVAVRLDRSTVVPITVRNTGSRTMSGTLWDTWPDTAGVTDNAPRRFRLAPGDAVTFDTPATPTRRGDRRAADPTIRVHGPLGLAGWQFRPSVPATIRVLPAFRSERHLAARTHLLTQSDGHSQLPLRGQRGEFDSYREYVAGDDVRTIDWRASARATDVMTRTYRPERDRRILCILDTGRASAGRTPDGTRLDTCMEAVLLLARLATGAGDRLDLLAYDRQLRAEVVGASGKRLQHKLMHAMAPLTPVLDDTDYRGLARLVRQRGRSRSLIVWCVNVDAINPADSEFLPALRALTHRHRVVVLSVTDPAVTTAARTRGDAAALYTAAAAERALAADTITVEVLRRLGVTVLAAPPSLLPLRLAEAYLTLKRTVAL